MNTMRHLNHLFSIVFIAFIAIHSYASELDSLRALYIDEIDCSVQYTAIRQARIDSILRQPDHNSAASLLAIGELYTPYQSDSAAAYLQRVVAMDSLLGIQAKIRMMYLFSTTGQYDAGIAIAESFSSVPSDKELDYYDAAIRIYTGVADRCNYAVLSDKYRQIAKAYQDTLAQRMARHDIVAPPLYSNLITEAISRGDYSGAINISDSVLTHIEADSHDYAKWAYRRSNIYRTIGDSTQYEAYLTRSAIADVRAGITDNGASWLLAEMAYKRGDLDMANRVIKYSLSNAAQFDAPLRYVQTNPIGHIINNAYDEQQAKFSRTLLIGLVIMAIMLGVVITGLFYGIRQNRRLHRAYTQLQQVEKQLLDTSRVKEQYICRYLEVYSEYIRRLTKMARKAGEKDAAAFMDREMEQFYASFDSTFLSLYGNFITDFNALLRPEEQQHPKPGELMTTELRIFALIRLGITSTAKIAALLGYSPNTISNYRVRIKNAALTDREHFEQHVSQLG